MKKIYIDLDLLLVKTINSIGINTQLIQELAILKYFHPKAQFHILFNHNHLLTTFTVDKDFKLRLFPLNPPHSYSTTLAIRKLLQTEHPVLFDSIDFFCAETLKERKLAEDHLFVSNTTDLQPYFSSPIYQIEAAKLPKGSGPILTARQVSFSLNPADLQRAIIAVEAVKDTPIKLLFDLDDSIIKCNESFQKNQIVLNYFLVEKIAELLNSMESISHVECSLLSARVDDFPMMPIKAQDSVLAFTTVINEKIKDKHPQGISFLNIFCLQASAGVGKKIVTVSKKDLEASVIERKLMSSSEQYSDSLALLESRELHIVRNYPRNKSVFLKYFLIPEMEKSRMDFTAIFFDDNPDQLAGVLALEDPRFHCVHIMPPFRAAYFNPHTLFGAAAAAPRAPTPKPSRIRERPEEEETTNQMGFALGHDVV